MLAIIKNMKKINSVRLFSLLVRRDFLSAERKVKRITKVQQLLDKQWNEWN